MDSYKRLLGDGSQFGIKIEYGVQHVARGIADAFLIAEEFIAGERCCLILGDNLFYGATLEEHLREAVARTEGATVFGYPVKNPRAFGVVEFDKDFNVVSIEEKPQQPKSRYAVPGLYFYDENAVALAKTLKPSARGELEITGLNEEYLKRGKLHVQIFGRGMAWLDTGTMDSLVDASDFVRMVEQRQGVKISAPEEIAYKNGWISKEKLLESAARYGKSPYGKHLKAVAEGRVRY